MTAHAETLTTQRPARFAADELNAAARWVSARCADAPPALLVDTFLALDAILARSRGVVALRHLMPGSGLELLYLPPERDARAELASLPGKYAMPSGCILVARVDGEPAGCVALRAIGDGVSEMKRLYVRPEFRGLGLGRKLAERIIGEARGRGYERIRLDTIPSRMAGAVCLYRALEFRDIPPYCDNPFPDAMFLELRLS